MTTLLLVLLLHGPAGTRPADTVQTVRKPHALRNRTATVEYSGRVGREMHILGNEDEREEETLSADTVASASPRRRRGRH